MKTLFAFLALLFAPLAASASNCPTYPYTLTNGQVADANQVMANFISILSCANGNLVAAGVNSSITALTGLTVPLSVAQGGTGQNTSPVLSFNGRSGSVNLLGSDVVGALGYSPVASAVATFNTRSGAVTLLGSDVSGALGYTPAPLSSPALTGTPTAPTQSAGDNSMAIATDAFVQGALGSALPSQGGNAGKYLETNGSSAFWSTVGNTPTAYVNANCSAGGCTINGSSLNVSSVTRSAAGVYSVNFSSAYPDTNYISLAGTNNFTTSLGQTTGHLTVLSVCGGTIAVPTYCDGSIWVAIFGS